MSLTLIAALALAAPPSLDLLLVNARIWTGDPAKPEAAVMGIANGRIVVILTADEAKAQAAWLDKINAARVIDAQGRRVVPGFHDSHLHLLGGGAGLSKVALKDAPDKAEFGRRLREFDKKLPPGRWLLGGDWDHDRALKGELPTAALIDEFVPDRPVFLRRYDGHMAIVNTKALKMAGITAKTPDPIGGVIYRDPRTGEPTGLLRDNAMDPVSRLVPAPDEVEIAEALRAALDEIRAQGITCVEDMDGNDAGTRRKLLRLYQRLAREGRLTTRIGFYLPIAATKELADLGAETAFGNDWVNIGGVKGFIDGSLGSSTAKMFDSFVNEPGSTGVFVTPPSIMRTFVANADKAGLSVAIHGIGDRGNAEMLDIFAAVEKANGPRDRRFRIEHAQHLRPADYARFKQHGVIASMQPYHVIDDGRWAEGRIGATRCASSYAFRSLLDAGAILAFGSDWPVAPLNVMEGIDAAVNRRPLDGKHPNGWFPAQRITVAEAVTAYTRGSAFAAHKERDRGTLTAGKLGDFVILSRDIFEPKERDNLAKTKILATVVGGKVVFEPK